jgi:hypothetical protein
MAFRAVGGVQKKLLEMTPAERTSLQGRGKQIAPWIKRASPNEIKDIVSRCFMGLGGEKVAPAQAEMMMAQYVTTLDGLPAWAIERACLRFARGEVKASDVGAKHIEIGMRPSSAHLRVVAFAISESIDREAMALSRALRAQPPKRRKETEEERAAGLAKTAAWIEQSSGPKEKPVPAVGYAVRVREQLKARAREKILQEYEAAGLFVPEGEIVTSLPMLLEMGWTIVQTPTGRNALAKPDGSPPLRRSLGI